MELWQQPTLAGFLERLGRENVCAHIDAALNRANEILAKKSPASGPLEYSNATQGTARSSAPAKPKA